MASRGEGLVGTRWRPLWFSWNSLLFLSVEVCLEQDWVRKGDSEGLAVGPEVEVTVAFAEF